MAFDVAGKVIMVDEFSRTLDKLEAELNSAEAEMAQLGAAGDRAASRVRGALGQMTTLRAPSMAFDTSGVVQAETALSRFRGKGLGDMKALASQMGAMALMSGNLGGAASGLGMSLSTMGGMAGMAAGGLVLLAENDGPAGTQVHVRRLRR